MKDMVQTEEPAADYASRVAALPDRLKVLDLFSGTGAFSLGLERSGGFETVAFAEADEFCRRVLTMQFPGVRIYEDVREVTIERLRADGIAVDVICGGFPCQDLSRANGVWSSRPGLQGARSGLWSEYARCIREFRPRFALVENVTDLLGCFGEILRDLAESGYDAEWDCLRTTVVGGRCPRDRLWVVSYPSVQRHAGEHGEGEPAGYAGGVFDAFARAEPRPASWQDWLSEPAVPRVVNGTPHRLDRRQRTGAIGNAVVPQIPEMIGRAILSSLVIE